jgi:DNA-binding response OmpR family regulator
MNILIAEDDKTFRTFISEILQNAGYKVFAEENGQLAWETLNKESIDMAVFDINMPVLGGLDLLKKVRADEKYKHLPVLFLTVRAMVDDQVRGYETGVDDYITKPFDSEVFLARIKALSRRIHKK